MSGVNRTGQSILLGVDGLFLGSLLFIAVSVRSAHIQRLRDLGVGGPGWPDTGGAPGALLPWAAAGMGALAALLVRLRSPVPPLLALLGAIGLTAAVLYRIQETGAFFGHDSKYGTVVHALAAIWIAHLLGAMVALAKRTNPARFLVLQALYGAGLAALVYPA